MSPRKRRASGNHREPSTIIRGLKPGALVCTPAGPSTVFLVSRRRRIRESHKHSPTWPSGSGMAPRLAVSHTDMSPCRTPSSPHLARDLKRDRRFGRGGRATRGVMTIPIRGQPADGPYPGTRHVGAASPSPTFAVQPPGIRTPVLRMGREQARKDRHTTFTPNAPRTLQHAWVIFIWGQRLTSSAHPGVAPGLGVRPRGHPRLLHAQLPWPG